MDLHKETCQYNISYNRTTKMQPFKQVTFQTRKHSRLPYLYMERYSLLPALGVVQAEQTRLDPGFQLPKLPSFRKWGFISLCLVYTKCRGEGRCPLFSFLLQPCSGIEVHSRQLELSIQEFFTRYTLFAQQQECVGVCACLYWDVCVQTIFPGSLCVCFNRLVIS